MSTTPRLALPEILAAQAQKHVTHNEALADLDSLVQLSLESRTETDPPATPNEGAAWLVAATGTGAWSGHDGEVAAFVGGAWRFHVPSEGFRAWVKDEAALIVLESGGWTVIAGAGLELQDVQLLGVNATADATNRLAVRSAAVLVDAITVAGGGTGDTQIKINKEAAGDTASLIFQTGYSGRAEFGLAGDDDFHVKVSANGADWTEAAVVDAASGAFQFQTPPVLPTYTVAGLPDAADFEGGLVHVSDETGGAVPAFSDGTDWRRVTDRAVVS